MTLTEEQKIQIFEDYESCKDIMYGKLTEKERKNLGAFYTPPNLVIKMIEKFSDLEGDICDPCVGAGLLLSGCIIAGANPKRCYGIELDECQAELCRNRLEKYGVPRENIVTGDCLDEKVYENLRCYKNKSRFCTKIITNPSFKIKREKFRDLLLSADSWVTIHTFKFCNNELKRFELIEYEEWPEVTNIILSIASSTMKQNYIEKPVFYKPQIKDDIFDGCEDYIIFYNSHFADGQFCKTVKQNKPSLAKKLIFKNITPDIFICTGSNKFVRAGDRLKRLVYPRSFIKIFEKHLDDIYMDTKLFGNIVLRHPCIRQEFVDENNN